MRFTKTRKSDWYKQPTMVGHERCKDTIYLAEEIIFQVCKNKTNQSTANYVIRDIPEWHYWNSISKKELNMLRFVLRRLDKAFSEKGGLTRLLAMSKPHRLSKGTFGLGS